MIYELMGKVHATFMNLKEDTRGVTAVEYAIIAVVMSGIVLAVFQNGTLNDAINDAMTAIADNISQASDGPGGAGPDSF